VICIENPNSCKQDESTRQIENIIVSDRATVKRHFHCIVFGMMDIIKHPDNEIQQFIISLPVEYILDYCSNILEIIQNIDESFKVTTDTNDNKY